MTSPHRGTARVLALLATFPAAALAAVSPAPEPPQEPSSGLTGHWEGHLTRLERDYPLRLDLTMEGEAPQGTLDLSDYSLYGAPLTFDRQGDVLVLSTHLLDCELRLSRRGGGLEGSAVLTGLEAQAALTRTSDQPTIYRHHEVRFESGDARLAGTLVTPDADGPFPTVVWTHGSGPDTRDTFYYHGRAHLMAQQGIASLIYDKRGAGRSTGTQAYLGERLVADATVALDTAFAHPRVDPERVGIAGFSQGGWVAPAAAARRPRVAFVLVGATPGVTGSEQNVYSLRTRLVAADRPPEEIEQACDLLAQLYRYYATGEDRPRMEAALNGARSSDWFQSGLFQRLMFWPEDGLPAGKREGWTSPWEDPMTPWRTLKVPVLSVWGERDRDVPVELSRDRIRAALAEAGNRRSRLTVFPRASHGLWVLRDDEALWDWPRQAPGYHELLVTWVRAQVGLP